ncbi:MAG: GGDEF domain-containing protein [Butyrivibrio sp.]|nr:GGDEF domain-containing protein [Butyrivibrio sp.]
MDRFLYTEINVFAIAVLALMYQGRRKEFLQKDQIMFNRIILSMIFVLIIDTLTWVLNGLSFPYARIVCHIINGLFWFCSMIPCGLGFLYGYYKLYGKSNTKVTRIAIFPVIYAAVFLLLNIRTGWVYTVSADNIYRRGPFYLLLGIVPFIHIFAAEILMIKRGLHVPMAERSPYKIMAAYLILPLVGSAIQVAFYGTSTIWVSLTIAVIVFYNYLQKGYISVDSLTGLANRRRFDSYTRGRMENLEKNASLYLMMLDINNFKGINDTFGHAQGDQVLVMTARMLLKASEGIGAFTARVGGDEFVIVMCNTSISQVEQMVHKIEKYMQEENDTAGKKYTVSLAIGYAGMKGSDEISLETLYDVADKNMYANKRRREERLKDGIN